MWQGRRAGGVPGSQRGGGRGDCRRLDRYSCRAHGEKDETPAVLELCLPRLAQRVYRARRRAGAGGERIQTARAGHRRSRKPVGRVYGRAVGVGKTETALAWRRLQLYGGEQNLITINRRREFRYHRFPLKGAPRLCGLWRWC